MKKCKNISFMNQVRITSGAMEEFVNEEIFGLLEESFLAADDGDERHAGIKSLDETRATLEFCMDYIEPRIKGSLRGAVLFLREQIQEYRDSIMLVTNYRYTFDPLESSKAEKVELVLSNFVDSLLREQQAKDDTTHLTIGQAAEKHNDPHFLAHYLIPRSVAHLVSEKVFVRNNGKNKDSSAK